VTALKETKEAVADPTRNHQTGHRAHARGSHPHPHPHHDLNHRMHQTTVQCAAATRAEERRVSVIVAATVTSHRPHHTHPSSADCRDPVVIQPVCSAKYMLLNASSEPTAQPATQKPPNARQRLRLSFASSQAAPPSPGPHTPPAPCIRRDTRGVRTHQRQRRGRSASAPLVLACARVTL
jgi:hypothetical protein